MDKGLVKHFYDTTGGSELSKGYEFWDSLRQEILDFIKKEINHDEDFRFAEEFSIETRGRRLVSQYNEDVIADDAFMEMVIGNNPVATIYSSRNDSNYVNLLVCRVPYDRIKELTEPLKRLKRN